MHRILIDIEQGQAVMLWSDLDTDVRVFVRYAPGDIRSCPEWSHDQSKYIGEILDEAGLFCDHCEEHFTAEHLTFDKESGAKYCKSCHDWLAEMAEMEADRAEEQRAEAKGAEV